MQRPLEQILLGAALFAAGLIGVSVRDLLLVRHKTPSLAPFPSFRGCVSCFDDPFLTFARHASALPFDDYAYLTLGLSRKAAWTTRDADWILAELAASDGAGSTSENTPSDRRELIAGVLSWGLAKGRVSEPDTRARLLAALESLAPVNPWPDPEPAP